MSEVSEVSEEILFPIIFLANFFKMLYDFPPMLNNDRIDLRLFQLTHYDYRTRYVPDADGAKWSLNYDKQVPKVLRGLVNNNG